MDGSWAMDSAYLHPVEDAPSPTPFRPSRFDLAHYPRATRAQQVASTLANACADSRFHDAVMRGDAARDAGDWAQAERDFGTALRRYPLHWGYCIQFAHAVKEQGHFPRAEAWYRSAVALGAPDEMVDEHLAFVLRQTGYSGQRHPPPVLDVAPLLAPPTVSDIALLAALARIPGQADETVTLTLLREARDNRAVLLRLIALPAFARANRAFLTLLRA
jgi:tetratricopeptide (TPR) repeat protein